MKNKLPPKIKPLGPVTMTGEFRFPRMDFKDLYGEKCHLSLNSIVLDDYLGTLTNPGTSAIWLGTHRRPMHLSKGRVVQLVTHLVHWLDTGNL